MKKNNVKKKYDNVMNYLDNPFNPNKYVKFIKKQHNSDYNKLLKPITEKKIKTLSSLIFWTLKHNKNDCYSKLIKMFDKNEKLQRLQYLLLRKNY